MLRLMILCCLITISNFVIGQQDTTCHTMVAGKVVFELEDYYHVMKLPKECTLSIRPGYMTVDGTDTKIRLMGYRRVDEKSEIEVYKSLKGETYVFFFEDDILYKLSYWDKGVKCTYLTETKKL